tara:strand:- start:359 stop:1492 length:1134 start_codon:yes stop_codon:yes gene_type:complete
MALKTMVRKVNSSMRYSEMIFELAKHLAEAEEDEIVKLKKTLADKIAGLPADDNTIRIVNKIEDLLQDIGAGGRVKSLLQVVTKIEDEDVQKATNKVAKTIAAIDFDTPELKKLFKAINQDKMIKYNVLLAGGQSSFADAINGYGKSPNVTELVDDLMSVVDYGIGPGEFMLAVLSKSIKSIGAAQGKGDLVIAGKTVELKTEKVGGARFLDREIRPTSEYMPSVEAFKKKYEQQIQELENNGTVMRVPSGMNEKHLANLLQSYPDAESDVAKVIGNLFAGLEGEGIKIAKLLAANQVGNARQLVARANVQNYLNLKRQSGNLDGILFVTFTENKREFLYISKVQDIDKAGLRLDAKPAYLIKGNDNPFPQITIVEK